MLRDLRDMRAMFCSTCRQLIQAPCKFCFVCGTPVPEACSVCGSLNSPGARYCRSCGITVGGAATAPYSFSGTPNSAQAVLSERKVVTIMFVDMIESLAAIRGADPEKSHEMFSSSIALMTEAVHTFGGTVVRTLGDGIMVVFGAPAAQEDHAARACHAALHLLKRLADAQMAQRVLDVRIGLHSGVVAVGSSPNDFNMNYDATGAVVHIASRVEKAAPRGKAAITAVTRALLREAIITVPLGSRKLKGLDDEMELFVLVRPAHKEDKEDGQIGHRQEPFVGRAGPMAELENAFRAASVGHGQLITVAGEAGIGKTTLIERFLSLHHTSAKIARGAASVTMGWFRFIPFVTSSSTF